MTKEEYLFKIAHKILNWSEENYHEGEYTEKELSDLIMLELINIPLPINP